MTTQKVALQFSGGKDSMACLYLLRDKLPHIAVYWMNAGDGLPEVRAVIDEVRQWIPNFIEVRSDVAAWRDANGYPADAVPVDGHLLGNAYGLAEVRVSNRFDCCFANLMLPLHRRMIEDGITHVIRGTKLCDTGRIPAQGDTDSYHISLPLIDWSHEEVMAFLADVGAPISSVYQHVSGASAPECMGCSAWWDDGKAVFLRDRYPAQYVEYIDRLKTVRGMLSAHLAKLDSEIGV
jgi:phosphoadenosine phosphosulfate reductase